jgi:hypothetical protein
MYVLPGISPSFPAVLPQNFPPAGGIGDWGYPQQARLSYKRYACASAANGGVGFRPVRGALFLSGIGDCNIGRALPTSS